MSFLDVALAFTAGMYTLFSPCSFPLLPGYVSYYLGSRSSPRAAVGGLICALSIIAVFSVMGMIVSLLGGLASKYIPLLQVGAGAMMVLMGFMMVFEGRALSIPLRLRAPRRRGFAGLLLYGIAYGLASAGCSAPIFFSIVLYAFSFGGAIHGLMVFIAYAMGIGIPLVTISIFVVKIKDVVVRRVMRAASLMQAAAGYSLIAIGLYLLCQSLMSTFVSTLS
ncbi:MAG: cytochrome c biogenesis protein CcdA [Candidatus Nezhaarchaeales archaeon]